MPDHDEIRRALGRILSSEQFRTAKRSGDLLRYLAEAVLTGRAGHLKEYTIGIEALGRSGSFDPRFDSTVRSEASRLRNRLALYYAGEGRDASVVISLPTGGYQLSFAPKTLTPASTPRATGSRASRLPAPWAAGLVAAAAAAVAIAFVLTRPSPAPAEPVRFDMATGANGRIMDVRISPDGRTLAMTLRGADGTMRLALRPTSGLEAHEIPGASGADKPFFSPDGQWVGFFQDGRIMKAPVNGSSAPVFVTDYAVAFGAGWGDQGEIAIAGVAGKALWRVPQAGGKPLLIIDFGMAGRHPTGPVALPGGRGLLFTSLDTLGRSQIEFVRWDGRASKVVRPSGFDVRYANGQILYSEAGRVYAQTFDIDRAEVVGEPFPLTIRPQSMVGGYLNFDIDARGTLVYLRNEDDGLTVINRVDETGAVRPLIAEPGRYSYPSLAPDGDRLLYVKEDGVSNHMRVRDLQSGADIAISPNEGHVNRPVWSLDGRYVFYQQEQPLMVRRADGIGGAAALSSDLVGAPWSTSPDGKLLEFGGTDAASSFDIYTMTIETTPSGVRAGHPVRYQDTPTMEVAPAFSPDGKWIAYTSFQGGTYGVYVGPFPPGNGQRTQISRESAGAQRWPRSGSRIFMQTADAEVVAVSYRIDRGKFIAGTPQRFGPSTVRTDGGVGSFDVAADGKSVVVVAPATASEARPPATISVVQNFFATVSRH